MHLHKTGGSSIIRAIHSSYRECSVPETPRTNLGVGPKRRQLRVKGSCHQRQESQICDKCSRYTCSWAHLQFEGLEERNTIDIAVGHQFLHGKESIQYLLPAREVKTFTILRHPLHRKLSAFFHFFVRRENRSEQDVNLDDITNFLLEERGRKNGDGRKVDIGPNYYAGRLLSEGYHKYFYNLSTDPQHYYFQVSPESVENARIEMDKFLFVGIQELPGTTLCILRQMLQSFERRLDISDMVSMDIPPSEQVLQLMQGRRENIGTYHQTYSPSSIWETLSREQRAQFARHEETDLGIYRHGLDKFIQQAHFLGCAYQLDKDLGQGRKNQSMGGDFRGLFVDAIRQYQNLNN